HLSAGLRGFSFKMGKSIGWAAAVLLLMFGLALTSMAQKSPTFDEQGFVTRGVGYLRGQNRHMRVGHPLGLNALNAIFVAFDDRTALPTDDPSWAETGFHRPSELFLWEIGNDVERIMFLARLPSIWLGLVLAAISGRWAWEMTRNHYAGLLALALIALDPNILAHTRLATTDLGLAAGAALAAFTLWRFLREPSWATAVVAGAAFGLLQNTKFTALLFIPLFALVILINLRFTSCVLGNRRIVLVMLATYPLVALLTLWAAYGFQVGTLPETVPLFPQLADRTLPLAHHVEQLLDIGGRLQKGTPAFLLGRYAESGWWYYFPVAFLLKTPLPVLILLGWSGGRLVSWSGGRLVGWLDGRMAGLSIGRVVERGNRRLQNTRSVPSMTLLDLFALLIPAVGYFAIALTTDVNLGYRHLLPILSFLTVFIAAALIPPLIHPTRLEHRPRTTHHARRFTHHASRITFHVPRFALTGLVAWLALSTLFIYPHFLAYFNALAGGPNNGWRALVDSNIDWGQDLGALKRWMDENGVEHVWLSYFGEARPEYYGIGYTGLDSFPPRLMNPQARPFYPYDPAPGVYAISVTNLQGVLFENHDQFAWFRQRQPVAKVGYSIFIYKVEPHGEAVELALSGVQVDEIAPEDFSRLQTNQITLRWFDAAQSWLLPYGDNRWLALGQATSLHPAWASLLRSDYEPVAQSELYSLYRQVAPAESAMETALARFAAGEGQVTLLDVSALPEIAAPGQTITLITRWRQEATPQPLKIFVHGLDAGGQLVTQWDGLGAAWAGWRQGDVLLQAHSLLVPVGTHLAIWTGVYDPASGQRWQTAGGDRLYLGQIEIANGE
ncbi:MAG TPA: phospholipid carrier-dependent glycosyltransferase, partial [Anaerolineae bacterium]